MLPEILPRVAELQPDALAPTDVSFTITYAQLHDSFTEHTPKGRVAVRMVPGSLYWQWPPPVHRKARRPGLRMGKLAQPAADSAPPASSIRNHAPRHWGVSLRTRRINKMRAGTFTMTEMTKSTRAISASACSAIPVESLIAESNCATIVEAIVLIGE